MRSQAKRTCGWGSLWSRSWVIVVFAACMLVAPRAFGQNGDLAAPGKSDTAARPKSAEQPALQDAEEPLVTRVYNVIDLITAKPSYRFEHMFAPGTSGGAFGRGGGMGGSMGGMFSVADPTDAPQPPEQPSDGSSKQPRRASGGSRGGGGGGNSDAGTQAAENSLRITTDDLIGAITSCIAPETWDTVGGHGSIQPLAGTMVISQTAAVHKKIERFLEELRASTPGMQTVSIRAIWLLLDLNQLGELLGERSAKPTGIDRKRLEEIATKAEGYIGAVTCFNGQTVHIASGRSTSAVVSAIPVVGGSNEVGYQPVVDHAESGAVLEITPQLLPNTSAVVLDLCTSVIHTEVSPEPNAFLSSAPGGKPEEGKPAAGGANIKLDRMNVVAGQLATTLKVPLGEFMLIGGLTREPAVHEQSAAATPQLYLFIEAESK